MTEIAMRREGSHLVPVDEVSAEAVREIPTTQDVLVTVKTPRNLRQFRLAWALAQKVSEAVDFLHDREDAMNWMKIKARHVTMLQNPRTKQVAIIPKSIAFASLGQDAFARIFNRMVYVTCTEIIPGLKDGDLRDELEQMVGADVPASAPDKPVGASDGPEATGQGGEASSAPRKPGGRPKGSKNKPKGEAAPAEQQPPQTDEREPEPHRYVPSAKHAGDCEVCGHLQGAPIHSPSRAELERGRGAPRELESDAGCTAIVGIVPDVSVCKTAADYIAYAMAWIDTAPDKLNAQGRWDNEMDTRNALKVPVVDRARLQGRIDARFAK